MGADNQIGTPLSNLTDNSDRSKAEMQRLQILLKKLGLAYEGYLCSHNYANSPISDEHRNEGMVQKKVYAALFNEGMDAINELWKETTNIGGR